MSQNALDPRSTYGTKLTTASVATAVLSVEAGSPAAVWGLWLTNTTGGAVTVLLQWYDFDADGGATSYTLMPSASLAAGDVYWHDLHGMWLDDGDELRVTQGTADALHVVVVVSEIRRT